jgi:hypothetical protein
MKEDYWGKLNEEYINFPQDKTDEKSNNRL